MRTADLHLVLIAKSPAPGLVKTRLCPPLTPPQAAAIAAAALADTLETLAATPAALRTLVLDGDPAGVCVPATIGVVAQRAGSLGERLHAAFLDAFSRAVQPRLPPNSAPAPPVLLLGMDTPQVTSRHLAEAARLLGACDAVIGPADDGGFWSLALREPSAAAALVGMAMSRPETGDDTARALVRRGLRVRYADRLRDVDTAADADAVAAAAPGGHFATAWRAMARERVAQRPGAGSTVG